MQVGDLIDALDLSIGAWFEADIVKITLKASDENEHNDHSSNKGDSARDVDDNHNIKDVSTKHISEQSTKDIKENGELPPGGIHSDEDTKDTRNTVSMDTQDSCSDDSQKDLAMKPAFKENIVEQCAGKITLQSHSTGAVNSDGFIYHVKFEG